MPQPRDIVQHDQDADFLPAGVVQRRAVGVQPALLGIEETQIAVQRFGAGLGVLDELQEVGLAEDFVDAAAAELLGLDAQETGAGIVHAQYCAAAIDSHDAFFHAGKHGLVLALLAKNSLDPIIELGRHGVQRFSQHANFLHGVIR